MRNPQGNRKQAPTYKVAPQAKEPITPHPPWRLAWGHRAGGNRIQRQAAWNYPGKEKRSKNKKEERDFLKDISLRYCLKTIRPSI